MITSASRTTWPGDVLLDHQAAGLPKPCVARLKIFTIDNRLIERRIGRLTGSDVEKLQMELRQFLW